MQADIHSNATHFKGAKPMWWNNPPLHPQQPHHLFHPFMFLFMSSWIRRYFSAMSATPLLVSYQDSLVSPAPCFAACQQKGQPSFSQRRMCLLVPHPPQCVHKNLHNSSGKCQYTAIRCFWHYSRAPHCDLEKLAENILWANKCSKWWIILFSSPTVTRTEAGDNVSTETFLFPLAPVRKRKSDTYWRMWAWRNGPLLFLTGFW